MPVVPNLFAPPRRPLAAWWLLAAAGCALAGHARVAHAQEPPSYALDRIGLFGPQNTGPQGQQWSGIRLANQAGEVTGNSNRFTATGGDNGLDGWVYLPQTRTTLQVGLTGGAFRGSAGFQSTRILFQNGAGFVAGDSQRYTGVNTNNGNGTWVFDPHTNTTLQTGLTDAAHTGSGGLQQSTINFLSGSGHLAGVSSRFNGANVIGQNTWAFNPVTGGGVQTGLSGAGFTGTTGYQLSTNVFQSASGYVTGRSARITGVNGDNGTSTWVYNPVTNTTVQTGLFDAAHTGASGLQLSNNTFQNDAGHGVGDSRRYTAAGVPNGANTWAYNPLTNAVVPTGFSGALYTGTGGFQFSANLFLNGSGVVGGWSQQVSGATGQLGQTAWLFSPVTGVTTAIGLRGVGYTQTDGGEVTTISALNDAGRAAGTSRARAANGSSLGTHAWVYDPATAASTRIGLTGADQTGSGGFQESFVTAQLDSGLVTGTSNRFRGVNTANGSNTWVYNPATGATTQTGLTGSGNTGTLGYQASVETMRTQTGFVAGTSSQITSVSTANGYNSWLYNPQTGVTTQTGLTGAQFTGSNGYRQSSTSFLNPSGFACGVSLLANTSNAQGLWSFNPNTGVTTRIGLLGPDFVSDTNPGFSVLSAQNGSGQVIGYSSRLAAGGGTGTWATNPITGETIRTGLTDAAHTNSFGGQTSSNLFQNEAGVVVGTSLRAPAPGYEDSPGTDAWYFDPATGVSTLVTAGVPGSFDPHSNFSRTTLELLTASGYALGEYEHFFGGGLSEQRAFIYRPDIGFHELAGLVSGGITAQGWSTLSTVEIADTIDRIVGYGRMTGQTSTSQSVYVLTPTPAAASLFALAGVRSLKRRRG